MSQSPLTLEEHSPQRDSPITALVAETRVRAKATMYAPDATSFANETEEIVIEPRRGWLTIDRRELWRHRELLFFLVWRDVKVRYKQTVLGVAWAVLVPVLSMLVFTAIFGNFAGFKGKLPTGLQVAYPVYVYAGLLPWLFFSNAISLGGLSLVNQQQLLTKIYFPRLFVPTATVGSALVDMGLSFCIFLGLLAYYGIVPSIGIVFVPLLVVWTAVASLGIAYLLSALTVAYRDFKFVIPFTVQIWQFLSPVVYPSSMVPERYRWLLALNPLTGIIDGFRAAVFGVPVSWLNLGISALSAAALFTLGITYFRQTERRFADIA